MGLDHARMPRVGRFILLVWTAIAAMQPAAAQPRFEGPPLACVSRAETRNLFVTNKLVPPFRIMRQAALSARAEAIDIQLCRFQGSLVYDVTLLNEAGQIMHRLINAADGSPIAGYPAAGQGLRPPGEAFEPRPGRLGPPGLFGPAMRMMPFGGQGMGPQPGRPAGGGGPGPGDGLGGSGLGGGPGGPGPGGRD